MSAQMIAEGLINLNTRAMLEIESENYEDALFLFNHILEFEGKLKLGEFKAQTLLNIANVHMLKQDFNMALEHINKAIEEIKSSNLADCHASAIALKGVIQCMQNDYELGVKTMNHAMAMATTPRVKGDICIKIYNASLGKKGVNVRNYIDSAIKYFKASNDNDLLCNALTLRAEYLIGESRRDLAHLDLMQVENLKKGDDDRDYFRL